MSGAPPACRCRRGREQRGHPSVLCHQHKLDQYLSELPPTDARHCVLRRYLAFPADPGRTAPGPGATILLISQIPSAGNLKAEQQGSPCPCPLGAGGAPRSLNMGIAVCARPAKPFRRGIVREDCMLASSALEHSTYALLQGSPSAALPFVIRLGRLSRLTYNSSFIMMPILTMPSAGVARCH